MDLIVHLAATARLAIDPAVPGFSRGFEPPAAVRERVATTYLESHGRYIEARIARKTD